MSAFKFIGISMIGWILIGCQSKHVSREDLLEAENRWFTIVHPVEPKERDYVLNKHRSKLNSESKQTDSSMPRPNQDGAPLGPIPTFFEKVIPKREPISRYGNPDSYQVMGKKYEVMTNSTGYKSQGIASWYGTKFHKVRTSSGEKYDMYALTAAHKTLPLPTYVKVRNLENGKMAIVKVNDRGPFHDSRIMDLSYAAAVKLGVFPKGTAQVEIEALKTTQKSLHYYVQAGAFDSPALAEQLRIQLGKLTTSPVYVQSYNHRYLVQLGPFADKAMVARLKQKLENNNVHGAFSLLM